MDTLKPKYNSIDLTEVELPEKENTINKNSKEDENANFLLDVSKNDINLYIQIY